MSPVGADSNIPSAVFIACEDVRGVNVAVAIRDLPSPSCIGLRPRTDVSALHACVGVSVLDVEASEMCAPQIAIWMVDGDRLQSGQRLLDGCCVDSTEDAQQIRPPSASNEHPDHDATASQRGARLKALATSRDEASHEVTPQTFALREAVRDGKLGRCDTR